MVVRLEPGHRGNTAGAEQQPLPERGVEWLPAMARCAAADVHAIVAWGIEPEANCGARRRPALEMNGLCGVPCTIWPPLESTLPDTVPRRGYLARVHRAAADEAAGSVNNEMHYA